MPEKKKEECPHLNHSLFSGGMRADVCKVLEHLTGMPALLGPERLSHYCRGEYEKCLFPNVAQHEFRFISESSSEGVDIKRCVDFKVLEKVQQSYSSKQLRTRMLRVVYEYAGLSQSDMSEENGLWMYRVTDGHMLRLYRDIIFRRKPGRSKAADLQAMLIEFPGLGIMTFRFLEEYLIKKGLIERSFFTE